MRAFALALTVLLPASAEAQEVPRALRGWWGASQSECREGYAPNSNTYIDVKSVDQYENHCKLTKIKSHGDAIDADMSCEAQGEGYKGTVRISPTPNKGVVVDMRGSLWDAKHHTLPLIYCLPQPVP